MNKFKKLCITSTLLLLGSNIFLHAVEQKVTQGSSVGEYAKPGAPVDIHFTSQNVESGESSEVKIDLITSVAKGRMDVSFKLDPAIRATETMKKKISFDLTTKKKTYPIILHLTAEADGVYYVRLMVRIEGKGSRAFAVPLFIGEGRSKKVKPAAVKSASGVNLSVSKAVEHIE